VPAYCICLIFISARAPSQRPSYACTWTCSRSCRLALSSAIRYSRRVLIMSHRFWAAAEMTEQQQRRQQQSRLAADAARCWCCGRCDWCMRVAPLSWHQHISAARTYTLVKQDHDMRDTSSQLNSVVRRQVARQQSLRKSLRKPIDVCEANPNYIYTCSRGLCMIQKFSDFKLLFSFLQSFKWSVPLYPCLSYMSASN